MFIQLDKSGDRRLGLNEFAQAVPTLARWGIKITDAQASFKEIDTNGGGIVLFDEFVDWAMDKNLDLEDDDSFIKDELLNSPVVKKKVQSNSLSHLHSRSNYNSHDQNLFTSANSNISLDLEFATDKIFDLMDECTFNKQSLLSPIIEKTM